MASSLNSCSFIGNLGKDVEMRAMPNGKAVANFSIAVADSYTDKQTCNLVDNTEWVRCVAFDKLAEICGQYLKKGSKVYIQGRMKTRSYEKEGQTHYSTEITLSNMQMLDSRAQVGDVDGYPKNTQQANPTYGTASQPQKQEMVDDDIPW